MSTSSTVDRAFRAALYDTGDTALDTGASLLAADPEADAELARRGEEFVATAMPLCRYFTSMSRVMFPRRMTRLKLAMTEPL